MKSVDWQAVWAGWMQLRKSSGRWYKQVTLGDCNTAQPGVWNIEARAKWNGWNKMKGLSADECRARYLKQLSAKVPTNWSSWAPLDALKAEMVRAPDTTLLPCLIIDHCRQVTI